MNTNALRPRYDLGGCTVTRLDAGRFKLDGGAMFGLIPKPLWSRGCPADELNRIQLACNALLVEWTGMNDRRLIIETGHGAKYDAKERGFYDIDVEHWLLPTLQSAGVDPASVSDVAVTHLHFDHAGGLTYAADDRVRPTFPRAKVHVQRQEFADAGAGYGIMNATYREENLQPITDAGAWHLLSGAGEVVPGVRVIPTPGHTRGHQSIIVEGMDRALVFAGDLMPTRHHLGRAWNMSYDLYPLDNRTAKQRLLGWIADHDALLAIDHEVDSAIMTVRRANGWFELTPAAP